MAVASITNEPTRKAKPAAAAGRAKAVRPVGITAAAADPHAVGAAQAAREKFLPVTSHALIDRLSAAWPDGEAAQARRFMRYLALWRRQSYTAKLIELEQVYEPFAPDSDHLVTRAYSPEERLGMQKRFVELMADLLEQANFQRVDPVNVQFILTKDSAYGLDLQVDLNAFEEVLIYYRGASTITQRRRDVRRAYMTWKDVHIPVFRRMCLLFKLKPFEDRVREVMQEKRIERKEAERIVRRLRGLLPAAVTSDCIYMKLFKNMPRSDVEMIFPNTKVRFRLFDKIKFGVTTGTGVGMGLFGTIGKLAVAANPYTLLGAVAALGGLALRQFTNFFYQRSRYMVVLAQNLYFHAMADNQGVVTLLADRAAEEDVKEEMLLYSVLATERVMASDLAAADARIEQYLAKAFGIDADFDVEDALARLKREGIVTERADGTLAALSPAEAARRIDEMWDRYLDELPTGAAGAGHEVDDIHDHAQQS